VVGLRADLVRWYRAERRDLPWRRTRDPYAIVLIKRELEVQNLNCSVPWVNLGLLISALY
jgi:A/G-specific adenine glycosylase